MNPSQIVQPLKRRHMPGDFEISLDRYVGRTAVGGGYREGEARIPDEFGPTQGMRGFEQTYRNIIDYIVRITYRIWEDRDVEYIADTYSKDSKVFDDYGLQTGSTKIIADTHHTTTAFSNIRLIADEIVWAGDDEIGFHTSHRTLIRGTNDGASRYGPATGRDVDVLVIANCVSKDNEIFLEHVLYNNSSLLRQLGHDLDASAARLVATAPAGWPRDGQTWRELRQAANPGTPLHVGEPSDGFDVDRFVRQIFDDVWNRSADATLASCFEPNFEFHGPTDRRFAGSGPYCELALWLRGAFPDLDFQVDEVYWMGNPRDGFLTSVRWSAEGTHTGAGPYGEPTGREVQLWGITQHRIRDGRIRAEWMLFNELDLMMQIAAACR